MRKAATAGLALLVAACGPASPQTEAALPLQPAPTIVTDQFGYLPEAEKIALIREPVAGYDAGIGGAAAPAYTLREAIGGEVVRRLVPQPSGDVDELSGDRVWTVSFSDVTAAGTYIISSEDGAAISGPFEIGREVYRPVLREAFRTFYYQRAGIAKKPPFADPRWADGASHLGPGQDREARRFFAPTEAESTRDLSGGWYDAGDFNQYTNWTADYCRLLLRSYAENPSAWGDDFGIPESGNGSPDVLDEAKWGLDWLARMQSPDGSLLSVLGRDMASPPSRARARSLYGPASTSATLSAASAFALGAFVLRDRPGPDERAYADDLTARAIAAWNWAEANPAITFYNNDRRDISIGLGAGQQEVDAEFRAHKRIAAAIYLHALTGDARFDTAAKTGLESATLVRNGLIDAYRTEVQDAAFFAIQSGALDGETSQIIRDALRVRTNANPVGYRVPVDAMHWGSNGVMARTALLHLDAARLGAAQDDAKRLKSRAADYLHYLHGRNPLGKVYLSNMGEHGAENAVAQFYHGWFAPGTRWSRVTASQPGPAPGFLVGGPNPSYTWTMCCPSRCGGVETCGVAPPTPPYGQPPLKAYRDFNDGWPLNSWEVTENSGAYQAAYLRLLANFAAADD